MENEKVPLKEMISAVMLLVNPSLYFYLLPHIYSLANRLKKLTNKKYC